MRLAIIDLGTNSLRFDVHEVKSNGTVQLLLRRKMMIRLGQGVFTQGKIERPAYERALSALLSCQENIKDLNVKKVVAFATSALREAKNSSEFLSKIQRATGIRIRVISGQEEARLIAKGILLREKVPADKVFALIDIGGGSTEITIVRRRKIVSSTSLPLGTARLQQVFLKKVPPLPSRVIELRGYIQQMLQTKVTQENWPQPALIIGSSGTVRALAKIINKKPSKSFSVSELTTLVAQMSLMNLSRLLTIPRLEAKRVDMILSGSLLLEELAKGLACKKIRATEYSLRDGVLSEELSMLKKVGPTKIPHWQSEVRQKALAFGRRREQILRSQNLADQMFQRLKRLHKLDNSWITHLCSATILRKVGESVGLINSEQHAYYLVKNSDFPFLQSWEVEFIAQLCLRVSNGPISGGDLKFLRKDARKKSAFAKLLAMLRIIDALDFGVRGPMTLKRVEIKRGQVTLCFSGQSAYGVDSLVSEKKKELFEKVFKKRLLLRRI